MTKYGFNIRKNNKGGITIATPKMVWTVSILPRMSFEERVEAVKWSLLNAGFVWSEGVENLVRTTISG